MELNEQNIEQVNEQLNQLGYQLYLDRYGGRHSAEPILKRFIHDPLPVLFFHTEQDLLSITSRLKKLLIENNLLNSKYGTVPKQEVSQ